MLAVCNYLWLHSQNNDFYRFQKLCEKPQYLFSTPCKNKKEV